MWLVVGLGNPGKEYEDTRHNVGFMVIDALVRSSGAPTMQHKFKSELVQTNVGGVPCVLQKPTTFMNLSGQALQPAMAFFKIPLDHIIVIHDDLDLETGQIKLKRGGSAGGHNGLKSIDGLVGQNYLRLRAGIGHPRQTASADAAPRGKVVGHVLGKFRGEEAKLVGSMVAHCADAVSLLVSHGTRHTPDEALLVAQQKYHSLRIG
jgi:peptidyl-tRNA hydrolase, PTH1 family